MLVEQNAFHGINHPMMLVAFFRQSTPSHAGSQLDMFTHWFNSACYQMIVANGDWLKPHLERAYQHGLVAGEQYTKTKMIASPDAIFFKTYKNELEGVVDATVQQVTRAVSTGLLRRERTTMLYRRIVAVTMKVLEPRIRMLGHHLIVKLHNRGLLDQFKGAGITRLGIIPERLPAKFKRRRSHDHSIKDQDVNILTAGDNDVCPECEDYADAGPYELDEVEDTLPLHPECRCAYTPTDDARFAINRVSSVEELEAEELEAEED
jgi:hypothetical protein